MTTDKAAGHAPPPLALEDFFDGPGKAWGLFQDRFSKVRMQFTADTHGTWDPKAQRLKLRESFAYDDGRTEERTWDIQKQADGRYTATTQDLVGKAEIRGQGNAVNLRYRMMIPIGGRRVPVDFDDWMFRQDQDVIIDRADATKWGLSIGTLTIVFQRPPAEAGDRKAAE